MKTEKILDLIKKNKQNSQTNSVQTSRQTQLETSKSNRFTQKLKTLRPKLAGDFSRGTRARRKRAAKHRQSRPHQLRAPSRQRLDSDSDSSQLSVKRHLTSAAKLSGKNRFKPLRTPGSQFYNEVQSANQNFLIVQKMREIKKGTTKFKAVPSLTRANNNLLDRGRLFMAKSSRQLFAKQSLHANSQQKLPFKEERPSLPRPVQKIVLPVSHFYTRELNVSIDNSRAYVSNSIRKEAQAEQKSKQFLQTKYRTLPAEATPPESQDELHRRITFSRKPPGLNSIEFDECFVQNKQ